MFLVNSRLGLFTAAPLLGHPFSRSYGVILPSSLTKVLPLALGFSPLPPVSVYGTGICMLLSSFSRQRDYCSFPTRLRYTSALNLTRSVLHYSPALRFVRALPSTRPASPSVSLLRQSHTHSTGISACYPSATTLRPRLRPRLTQGG